MICPDAGLAGVFRPQAGLTGVVCLEVGLAALLDGMSP